MRVVCFLCSLFTSSACVIAPHNDQEGGAPGTPIDFSGYAIDPSAELEIQALDKATDEWVTVGTTRAAAERWTTIDGIELYPFEATVTLDFVSHAASGCYYGYSEVGGCIPEGLPRLRVYQETRGVNFFTFEEDGVDCLVAHIGAMGLASAVLECASPESPVITMSWVW